MSILTRINIFGARLQEPIKSTDRRGLRRRTIGLALLVVTAAVVPVYDWIYANFDFPWDYWVVDSKAESLRNLTLVASAFLGLILLLWRSTSAHIQSSVSQKTLHADRFKNAASMISEEEIPARIGGIRTISELAEVDEEYYYLHCQKLLTTFIRERSRDYWLLQDGEKTPPVGEIHPEGKTSFKGTIKIGAYYGQEPSQVLIEAAEVFFQIRTPKRMRFYEENRYVDFEHCKLSNIRVRFNKVINVIFDGADLSRSIFYCCTFKSTFFAATNIKLTIFQNCIFDGIDFTNTDVSLAVFQDCTFKRCTNPPSIFNEQLIDVINGEHTSARFL